jgi:multidrug efflux pump subunit AcrB
VDVRVQQPDNWPQFRISVDRIKAAEFGLTEQNVANSVLLGLSGSSQVQPAYWLDPKVGMQYLINVRAPNTRWIPCNNSMPCRSAPAGPVRARKFWPIWPALTRVNVPPSFRITTSCRSLTFTATWTAAISAACLSDIQPLVEKRKKICRAAAASSVRGQAETMRTSYVGLGLGLVIGAIVLIYFLLVVNFQSWLDPFIIITALPGALAGVMWGLFLSQTTLERAGA